MLELFIIKNQKDKQIMLLKDEKIIEFYNENKMKNRNEGNIFKGVVKDILEGMESAFVDIGTEKNSYIYIKDLLPKQDETKLNKNESSNANQKVNIKKLVKPNQKLLVQVKKDSSELKGARISTHINIPSKYIALMPNTSIVTVSQKIENKEEQQRLIKLVKENLSEGNGAVIRTSAEGKTQEIVEDIIAVEKVWKDIENNYNNDNTKQPKLLYQSQDVVEKLLTDLLTKNVDRIVSNDDKEIQKIKKLLSKEKEYEKIKIEKKSLEYLEEVYNLEKQISKMEKTKIWLKCGGFITIESTEALTAIDVNTGKFTDGGSFVDTTFMVNEQATIEIAKQLRLRDIGGIIIIDYIDMLRDGDKEKIEKLLKECLKEDRAKTQVEGFTKLDLMELTRKHICSHTV
ncbi:MAG: Rne/Rng family ribonuclease [Clostridia bacterium]|nr:Rne/Rng family ribonuclease [Clostridia bacterium]